MNNPFNRTVIVADGSFPGHAIPLRYIKNASRIICCDGSTMNVLNAGYVPDAIVGDMDSINEEVAFKFADRIYTIEEQDTNDLTKAVRWCTSKGYNDLVITGATGKREDHTIGNISLLAEYVTTVKVMMITDTGFFIPVNSSSTLPSFPGQQVSIFSIDCDTEITSRGLKYPLNQSRLNNWWQATLNESLSENFYIEINNGRLIIYLKFEG
ncbi:MAG TPA: thiamine diphosphokinase [Bacteroidales bacterium]|nr:thiamine diphosphokinase [Bacteroidales bacterium]